MATWWHDQAGRWPLLTPSQEITLGQQVRAWLDHPPPAPEALERRGRKARDRFVKSNLRLVIGFAERYRSVPPQYQDDLIQAGNLGLITAVERFDPARGYKFSTYAYWWIRQGIHHFLEHYGRSIRLPSTHAAQAAKLQAAKLELTALLNRPPSRHEIASRLGWSIDTIERIITRPAATLSLDCAPSRCEGSTVADVVADPAADLLDQVADAEQLEGLLMAMARLEPQAQRIIADQFLAPVPSSLRELARREQLSVELTRALIGRSLNQLRLLLARTAPQKPAAPAAQVGYGPQLALPGLE